jgi:hypothetical protein
VIALAASWVVTSLSDANVSSLGHWLDKRSPAIWGFLVGAVPSIAAYLFGKGAGKKEGKTEGFSSGIRIANAAGADEVAAELQRQADDHGLKVSA